jgi:hypothetical protein
MSKKKTSGENVTSGNRDSAQKPGKPKPAGETSAEAGEDRRTARVTRKRAIFVKYNKSDGSIVATHEAFSEANASQAKPWTTIQKGKAAARIVLTEELVDKELIDIHLNYKVVIEDRKPTLVLKA